jgi:hypothetical protein
MCSEARLRSIAPEDAYVRTDQQESVSGPR